MSASKNVTFGASRPLPAVALALQETAAFDGQVRFDEERYREPMRRFLIDLGRPASHGQPFDENMAPTGRSLPMEIPCDLEQRPVDAPAVRLVDADGGQGVAWTTTELQALARAAFISVAVDDDRTDTVEDALLFYIACNDSTEQYETVHAYVRSDPDQYDVSRRLAVVGPIHFLYDDQGRALASKAARPTICVSAAGMNFSANRSLDRQRYVQVDPETKRASLRADPDLRRSLSLEMRRLWIHLLLNFRAAGVQVPVLPAIGCGVFSGGIEEVPRLYAAALVAALRHPQCQGGFESVVLVVPNPAVYAAFQAVLEAADWTAEGLPVVANPRAAVPATGCRRRWLVTAPRSPCAAI